MKLPVFDLHCDTALALSERAEVYTALRSNHRHVDLVRAGELGGYCQCFAMFTTPDFEKWYQKPVTEVFDNMLSNLEKEIELNSDLIAKAGSTAEIEENRAAGKMSAILTLEGPAGISFDAGRLQELYDRGFRISTLSWNEQNILTGSIATGGGLTDAGREYVRECQRLGILVDVSHISDEAFWDIMKITEAPVIASHSNLRSICGHKRNLTEDMYRAIVETGGTAGINLFVPFVSEGKADLVRSVTTFSGCWSWTPPGNTSPWAAIWTAVTPCPRASRVSRATMPWPSGFMNGAWMRRPSVTFTGTTRWE